MSVGKLFFLSHRKLISWVCFCPCYNSALFDNVVLEMAKYPLKKLTKDGYFKRKKKKRKGEGEGGKLAKP